MVVEVQVAALVVVVVWLLGVDFILGLEVE